MKLIWPAASTRATCFVLAGLAVLTFLAFEQVTANDFVAFDDNHYVTENMWVRQGITLQSVAWAITTTHFFSWHPITWLSHMLDVELYGLDAAGHHLTNLLLHIFNTLLLFGLLKRMTYSLWRSALVAALFALHPLHVESVAWVSGRKDVLSAAFGLLSAWSYVGYAKHGQVRLYLLTAAFLAMALMAKPVLATLPLIFLLLDYWPLERNRFGRSGSAEDGSSPAQEVSQPNGFVWPQRSVLHLLIEKLPLLAISIASGVAVLVAQGTLTSSTDSLPLATRVANAPVYCAFYLSKMIWPFGLSVHYPYAQVGAGTPWTTWHVVGSALLLGGISLWVFFLPSRRYMTMGWLWFLVTLFPVIGIVPLYGQAVADRYSYLSLTGLFIALVWGGADLPPRWPSHERVIRQTLVVTAIATLAACLVVSRCQVGRWHDSVTLFEDALRVNPNNAIMHNNLGVVLGSQGKGDAAIRHYREALRINPAHANAQSNLALALASQGKLDEAISHYLAVLRISPDLADVQSNLGNALFSQGKVSDAVHRYREALRIDPGHAEAHNNLASILQSQGRLGEALSHYREAVRLNPEHPEFRYNLAVTLGLQGRFDEALSQYREVLRVKPDHAKAHYNLGVMLGSQGRLDDAARHYREVLRIEPSNAMAHNNLGAVLVVQGNLDEAISHYQEALRSNPNHAEAYYNLANALRSQGKLDAAIDHYRQALGINPDLKAAQHALSDALDVQSRLLTR